MKQQPLQAGTFRSRVGGARLGAFLIAVAGLLSVLPSCGAAQRQSSVVSEPQLSLERLIDDLYVAFSFDANGEADWDALRGVFAEGATFFAPIAPEGTPVGIDGEAFLRDFQAFIAGSPLGKTGYHERALRTRIDSYGTIAHAWVSFEAFVPGEEADRRGVDSIEFMLDGEEWKLVSFTTQYESDDLPLPERFLHH